jgi:hypothetical protein
LLPPEAASSGNSNVCIFGMPSAIIDSISNSVWVMRWPIY